MANKVFDYSGLACPLPILKAKQALKSVGKGETVEFLATDPGALRDFEAFCSVTGDTLVSHSQSGATLRIVIRRAGG